MFLIIEWIPSLAPMQSNVLTWAHLAGIAVIEIATVE